MARDTSKQATVRVPVESSFRSSGLVVAARETTNPIPHQNYNPQVSADVRLLTEALSSFIPTLGRKAQEEAAQKEKTDFIAGQTARLIASEEQLKNHEAYAKMQTPAFLRGYEHTSGAARATELGAQLTTEYDEIKDSLVTPGQYDKWMSGRLAEALEGVDSPDFQQGFLEHITRVDEKLRQDSIENNYLNIRQSAMADLMTATKGSIVTKAEVGDKTWTEDLQVMRDKGRIEGLSHKDINEMQFEIVSEIAIARGQPELLDQAFGHETPDTENPDRMIPPLASTPKWSGRIADTKRRAESVANSKKAERDEVAKLGHFKTIENEMAKGNYSRAAELADAGVANKMYSAEKAMSFHTAIRQERELARIRSDIGLAYDSGNYHLASRVPGYSEKLEKDVAAKKSDDRWAAAGDDPIKQESALYRDIIDMNNSGVVIPKYSEPMQYTASSPQQFQAAHALAKKMDSVAPGASRRLMESAVAIQHDFYETMLDSGFDPAEALALTREAATPAKRESAARQMGFNRRDLEDKVRELVVEDAHSAWFSIDRDAIDTAYIQNTVNDLATQHLMGSGDHGDPMKSIEWAAETFKKTHTAMTIPGTKEGYYLAHPGYQLPEEMNEAIHYVSGKLQESFKNDPLNYNEEGYYPLKLDDDTYALHHASGPMAGLPVMGKNGPFRIDPRQIMAEYQSRNVVSIEDLRKQHEAEQKKREEDQAATDAMQQRYRDQLEENRKKFERSKKRKRPKS